MNNSLEGIKVLDLTRVLAGPYCTQMLGDLGADIIKVERPGGGDDTRGFAPPFVKNDNGEDTDLSAYYCGANRNKKSITINLSEKEGQDLVKKLLLDFLKMLMKLLVQILKNMVHSKLRILLQFHMRTLRL